MIIWVVETGGTLGETVSPILLFNFFCLSFVKPTQHRYTIMRTTIAILTATPAVAPTDNCVSYVAETNRQSVAAVGHFPLASQHLN